VSAELWITIVACLLGCYFAACHTALKTFSRKRLTDLLAERGKEAQLERVIDRLGQFLMVTGFARACMSIIVVLALVRELEARLPQTDPLGVTALAFVIAGVLLGLFVVAIPTSWAGYGRERLLAWSLPILIVLRLVFMPIGALLYFVDPVVRRISGVDLLPDDEKDKITDEVLSVVEDHEEGSTVDDAQKEMLEAVFDLPRTSAGEIMTPRTDIEGIEVGATLDEVRTIIMEAGHSRVPVYEESLDQIVGILYAKDLIRYLNSNGAFDLRGILRDPYMVPESKSVSELLGEFKAQKVHIAIVLDEYGGTAGLVTIEDILEEIVGEIQDEYESEEDAPPVIQRIDETTTEVEARVEIDTLNDEMGLEVPEDEDYDTVGGFVFAQLGHIPDPGESFDFEGLRFTVTDVERTRVNRVRIERLAEADAPTGPGNGG